MALTILNFSFDGNADFKLPKDWSHTGVVGSGDLEILLEEKEQNGKVNIKITSPVTGFDHVWEKVLEKFVVDEEIGNIDIDINDNNATPFIVSLRLKQALGEAVKGAN